MTANNEIEQLLTDMRCQVSYTDKVIMPIPLYERIKERLQLMSKEQS